MVAQNRKRSSATAALTCALALKLLALQRVAQLFLLRAQLLELIVVAHPQRIPFCVRIASRLDRIDLLFERGNAPLERLGLLLDRSHAMRGSATSSAATVGKVSGVEW